MVYFRKISGQLVRLTIWKYLVTLISQRLASPALLDLSTQPQTDPSDTLIPLENGQYDTLFDSELSDQTISQISTFSHRSSGFLE